MPPATKYSLGSLKGELMAYESLKMAEQAER